MASVLDSTVALLTLAELKSFLAQDASDEFLTDTLQDNELEYIINAVGKFFNTYSRRKLVSAARTEYFDGDGSDTLYLSAYPITSTVSTISVYVDTDREYPASSKIGSDALVIYADLGKVRLTDTVFSEGAQSVKVAWTGGYTVGSTVPPDLRYAALIMAGYLWKQRKDKLFGLSGISIAGQSQTVPLDKPLPDYVKEILDQYRRWV